MICHTLAAADFLMTQVVALRRALLRRIRSSSLAYALTTVSRDAYLPTAGFYTRQFAVLTSNDGQVSPQTTLQRLTDASKLSWRLRATVKDVGQSLPADKGKRFYNRRVVEALEHSDYNRAWAIVETLQRRHPDVQILWPYTYNLLLRHLCKHQKTLKNANLTRILALVDVMVDRGCADVTSFQVAMAACSRARYLSGAKHVLEKMEQCEIKRDARIYGFLINCCARKRGMVQIAEQYFDEMESEGLKPTILVVNSMLRVLSRNTGRSKPMLNLVKRIGNEFGEVADAVTVRTMVYYLLSEGAVNDAVKFVQNVEKMFPYEESIKLPIKRQVVNALLDGCRQRGDWNEAEYVRKLLTRIEDENSSSSEAQKQDTAKLEKLIVLRDNISEPIVWPLDEQDTSRMSRPEQDMFFLNRSQNESFDRALERMHVHNPLSSSNHAIQKLSLKLKSKLLVLDEMIKTGTANASDFNALLGACGRQGQLKDAMSVLTKMKQYAESFPKCAPTSWSYNALLNACAVRGDIRQIEPFVNEIIENGLDPDQVTMNTVIKAHITNLKVGAGSPQTRLNTLMQALSFFEWCTENQKLDPGAGTYYALFRLFATYLESPSGDSRRGFDLVKDTEEESEVFNEGQDAELMMWMTEFITTTCRDAPLASLDIGVFNNGLDYYQRLGGVDESFALFNTMKERGFQPDDTSLGLLFATCASQQQFDVGLNFLDHIMTTDGYAPTLKVLSGAMQLCANSKNPDGALELFRAIEVSGTFKPTVETYEPLVYAYARVGNVSGAWDIASEMEDKLGRVSISIYNRVILACVEAVLPGRALEVLGVVRNKDRVNLDIISYNTALEAFVRAGERAAWWRKNRINREEESDLDEVSGGKDRGEDYCYDLETVENESDENLPMKGERGVQITEYFTDVKVKPKRDYEAEQRDQVLWARHSILDLIDEMQRSRVKPDMITFERAIATCTVNEDPEGVISIFDKLFDRKRVLKNDLVSDSSFSAYLKACATLQDTNRVVEAPSLVHKWHTATGQLPPEFLVTQLLDSLESVGEWRRAVRMLADMQSLFGHSPSVAVFNQVMQMCNRAEEYQLVAPIFATMQDATAYRVFPDAESYIQRIYAEEQRENWVAATDFFIEMKKKYPREEITHQQLQKIALGRYSVRQSEH